MVESGYAGRFISYRYRYSLVVLCMNLLWFGLVRVGGFVFLLSSARARAAYPRPCRQAKTIWYS